MSNYNDVRMQSEPVQSHYCTSNSPFYNNEQSNNQNSFTSSSSSTSNIHPRYVPDNYYSNDQLYYAPPEQEDYPQIPTNIQPFYHDSHMQLVNNEQQQQVLVWEVGRPLLPVPEPLLPALVLVDNEKVEAKSKEEEEEDELIDYGNRKPFISKLGYLLRNSELYADVIQWSADGTCFILAPSERFIEKVLPEIFAHGSLAAFCRQLNTYAFRHLSASQLAETFTHSPDTFTPVKELSAWTHKDFTRDRPLDANRLVPVPSKARAIKTLLKRNQLLLRVIDRPVIVKIPKGSKIAKVPKVSKAKVQKVKKLTVAIEEGTVTTEKESLI